MGDLIKGRVKGGRGEILVDNRNGPLPLSEGMDGEERNIALPGQTYEARTLTCAHCQATVFLNPQRLRPRGYCRKCHAYICDKPGCSAECLPIREMVDLQIKYPNIPIIERDKDGFPTFDLQSIRSRHKIH